MKGLMDRQRSPDAKVEEWRSSRCTPNEEIIGKLKSSGDAALEELAYAKTLDEVSAGVLKGLYLSLETVPVADPSIVPRKGIWECHAKASGSATALHPSHLCATSMTCCKVARIPR